MGIEPGIADVRVHCHYDEFDDGFCSTGAGCSVYPRIYTLRVTYTEQPVPKIAK